MSADPAYQAWREQKLVETIARVKSPSAGVFVAWRADKFAAEILNPARLVAQPNWAALGLGSADEAAGRN